MLLEIQSEAVIQNTQLQSLVLDKQDVLSLFLSLLITLACSTIMNTASTNNAISPILAGETSDLIG
ncbi:hypothetical protein AB0U73_24580, partial [Escherichia coli]